MILASIKISFIKILCLINISGSTTHTMLPLEDLISWSFQVIGLEVPHAHVHLIPINSMKDVSYKNKVKLETKDFETLVDQIKSFL